MLYGFKKNEHYLLDVFGETPSCKSSCFVNNSGARCLQAMKSTGAATPRETLTMTEGVDMCCTSVNDKSMCFASKQPMHASNAASITALNGHRFVLWECWSKSNIKYILSATCCRLRSSHSQYGFEFMCKKIAAQSDWGAYVCRFVGRIHFTHTQTVIPWADWSVAACYTNHIVPVYFYMLHIY